MGEAGLWREHVLGVGGHVGAPQTTVVLRREQADALLQGLEHVGLLQWCQSMEISISSEVLPSKLDAFTRFNPPGWQ